MKISRFSGLSFIYPAIISTLLCVEETTLMELNVTGIRLVCEPNPDYRTEITSVLSAESTYFPYDYYSIRFSTFYG